MHHIHIHAPPNMCTTYTYIHVHHQIPPKYKIYPVGLPSVLYETPGPNERSVLNQLFLVLFIVLFTFQVLFMKTALLFMKTATVFTVSIWVITKYRSFVRKTKYWIRTKRTDNYNFEVKSQSYYMYDSD